MQPGEEPAEGAGQALAAATSGAGGAGASGAGGGRDGSGTGGSGRGGSGGGSRRGPSGTLPDAMTSTARTWATATPYRLPLALAAVGLVVSAPFGGWRAAESEEVPVVAPGEPVEAAPFEITLERAYHSPRPSDSFPELEPGQQYVVVLGTLTSHHDATVPSGLLGDAIDLHGLPMVLDIFGDRPQDGVQVEPQLYSASDSTLLRLIGPGLTYDIGLVYVTESSQMPTELSVEISGHTWRKSAFDQDEIWADPAELATVVVPLAQKEPSTDTATASGGDDS